MVPYSMTLVTWLYLVAWMDESMQYECLMDHSIIDLRRDLDFIAILSNMDHSLSSDHSTRSSMPMILILERLYGNTLLQEEYLRALS